MSTRCNVIIKDSQDSLMFYRHTDGDPETVSPSLNFFLRQVTSGRWRDNVKQASGWLIMIGNAEASRDGVAAAEMIDPSPSRMADFYTSPAFGGWKVGYYEPTTHLQSDIEFLYEVDLFNKTLKGWSYKDGRQDEEITSQLTEV